MNPTPPSKKPPAAQLLDLLNAQAPSDPAAFWKYAAGAVTRYLPADMAARQRYFSDVSILLHAAYTTKCDMPDDQRVTAQIYDVLDVVEAYSNLPPFPATH